MTCDYCKDKLESGRYVQIQEKKRGLYTGRKLNFCFKCYKAFISYELKDLPIKTEIKAKLEKWKKESPLLN